MSFVSVVFEWKSRNDVHGQKFLEEQFASVRYFQSRNVVWRRTVVAPTKEEHSGVWPQVNSLCTASAFKGDFLLGLGAGWLCTGYKSSVRVCYEYHCVHKHCGQEMVLGPSTCSASCNTNLTATVVLKVHTTCQEHFYSCVSQYQKPVRNWFLNKGIIACSYHSAHTRYKR